MRQAGLPLAAQKTLATTQLIHGDCLEVMPTLAAGSVQMVFADSQVGAPGVCIGMNKASKNKIIRMYSIEMQTTTKIATMYNVHSGTIGRWLRAWGVKLRSASVAASMRASFSEEHKKKLQKARRRLFLSGYEVANKGIRCSDESRKKNMVGRMRSLLDLSDYRDISKLRFLTYYLSKHRVFFRDDDGLKAAFLKRFYFDAQFNAIYENWLSCGKDKWLRPSIDHIVPVSRGGTMALANLQFLTWFENRAKADMTENEWRNFCKKSKTTSQLFIRRPTR